MSRVMKDSGIPWIGEIPEEWECHQFRRIFVIKKIIANTLGYDVLSVTQSGIKVKDLTKNEGQIAQDYSKYQLVDINDYVMNHMDLITGFVDCSKQNGVTSPDYRVFRALDESQISLLYYLRIFQTCYKERIFYHLGQGVSGMGRWRLPAEQLKLFVLPKPPIAEQEAIAEFLDRKCGELDKMVALQEQVIEELKAYKQSIITEAVTKGLNPDTPMKPSGIDWIGNIPAHWRTPKMNQISNTITDFVASGSFESLRVNVPYLDSPDYAMLVRTTDLSGSARSEKRVFISKHSYDFLSNSNLFGGEIVLPNIGAVGDVYLVPKNLYSRMSLAPNAIMLKTRYFDKFYYYYFLGDAGKLSIVSLCQSTAQPKFNKTQLKSIRVLLPPLSEQREIADYLDRKCADIDALIALKQQKIEDLREYKKSLIYEYVTGKKQTLRG